MQRGQGTVPRTQSWGGAGLGCEWGVLAPGDRCASWPHRATGMIGSTVALAEGLREILTVAPGPGWSK